MSQIFWDILLFIYREIFFYYTQPSKFPECCGNISIKFGGVLNEKSVNNRVIRLAVEYVDILSLSKYKNNAKIHTQEQIEQIKASIKAFGFNDPLGVWKNEIVEGHGRYMACLELGIKEVPVIRLDHLNDAERKAYIIAHNKLTMNTGFDMEILMREIEDIKLEGLDIELTGFEADEIKEYVSEDLEPVSDDGFDEEEALSLITEPKSRKGDIWRIGKHTLMCGDSTKEDDVDFLMSDTKANLIVTDPPYNVNYSGATEDELTILNDNMDGKSFYEFLLKAYQNMYKHAYDGAGIYVFHADTEGINFRKALIDSGFKLAQCCIWVKNSLVMGRQDYHWQHEPVLYGWKPTAAHKWYSDRKQTTVWNFDKPVRNAEHPTMKPLDLIAYPITNSSKVNNVVIDLFGGSGSTLMACEQSGRICRTMELDERYCDVIIERYIKYKDSD